MDKINSKYPIKPTLGILKKCHMPHKIPVKMELINGVYFS